ncbi:MAG TPA: response regulator [Allocoleopsis sp.]
MSFDTTEKGVILIVDDTPTNLEMLLDFLETFGFKVAVAEDGESAVELAEYAPPDLILLDILMPGMDGFETCRRLKSNPATQDIPVIFMTALAEKVDKVKGLNLGAVDYITKPLEHEEVLARVNIHLRLRNLTKRLTEQNERLEQEIAERKQAQEEREQAFKALQESEARFRCLVESNMIGIILADLSGKITEANDAFLQMVGYDREMLRSGNLHWHDMTPPEYQHLEEKAIAQLQSCGVCTPFEKELIRNDGSRVPVMLGGTLVEESQQTIVGFVLDMSDAHRQAALRKQAEQKIREQAALLDITTDAILVRDLNNRIQYWNKGAERLYGWTAEDAIGKNANELLYRRETLDQLEEAWQSLAESGAWQSELYQVNQAGKDIIVASRWTLVRDENGQSTSILTVSTDITEKKQLEAQFLRTQRLESLGTLASGIAHDLNNVLTPIMMTIQLLEYKLPDEQSQQWLSILETNVKRAANLVKQVLSFSRGLAGKHTPLQVECLIAEIEQIVRQTFSKAIEIHTHIPTQNLWHISGDATQLHQVLMNLCINARDAMPMGGVLEISARNVWIDTHYARMNLDAKVGPYVVITVSDTGMGIKREIIDRIFEPFFTTKEVGKGTGLGLSTTIGIIKSHGGFVNVLSEVGKGTQFSLYLPVTQELVSSNGENASNELPRGRGELILVVDDEDAILEITKTSLEGSGYKVLTASNGIEAIALYEQHQDDISLVLVDMMMPVMDGLTTIQKLQTINTFVKVIAVSGLVSNYKIAELINNNVKSFLSKPYTSNELLEILQVVLGAK